MLPAFDYLKIERGLTQNTIETFFLGYCDTLGNVYMKAGMPGELPKLDFRFNNSVIFPICNWEGVPVGVSAKPLVSKPDLPKYINTEYSKADYLYGLNVAWPYCVDTKKVYVVEGNVDVLMVHQKGLKNVVGMLGSNFSWRQLALISRFVEKVVFVPDGDAAGSKFLLKIRELIEKRYNTLVTLDYAAVVLPPNSDPDTFLQKYTLQDLLNLEQPLFKTGV